MLLNCENLKRTHTIRGSNSNLLAGKTTLTTAPPCCPRTQIYFVIVDYKPDFFFSDLNNFFLISIVSDVVIEKGSKSPKMKPGAAAKGVNLQKDVSLAAPNPRAPVTRAPGPRRGPPGNARGPSPGAGRGRGHGGSPRK